ncbi:MAG: hypothetical protein H0T47_19435 [Planctomycetaceae bacterium]|nr:hypothetical protein [Planctomycetaceae bacterium]
MKRPSLVIAIPLVVVALASSALFYHLSGPTSTGRDPVERLASRLRTSGESRVSTQPDVKRPLDRPPIRFHVAATSIDFQYFNSDNPATRWCADVRAHGGGVRVVEFDSVTIFWAHGQVQRFQGLAADADWMIIAGRGRPFRLAN